MSSAEAQPSAASKASATWLGTFFVLMLVSLSALLFRMTHGADSADSHFSRFSAYLQSRGCVVAQTFNASVTSYRCDAPVAGAYIPTHVLQEDFQRSEAAAK